MIKIVSAVQFRDYILIFCENGDIFEMTVDPVHKTFQYRLMDRFIPYPK